MSRPLTAGLLHRPGNPGTKGRLLAKSVEAYLLALETINRLTVTYRVETLLCADLLQPQSTIGSRIFANATLGGILGRFGGPSRRPAEVATGVEWPGDRWKPAKSASRSREQLHQGSGNAADMALISIRAPQICMSIASAGSE